MDDDPLAMPYDPLGPFLKLIHPTGVGGWCELRALPSRARAFVPVGDVTGVARFLDAHVHENVYVGVATRRTATSGILENCGELSVLFVDVDFKTIPEATARERLTRFPLRPSRIVHSGAGWHVYWALKEPITLPADAAHASAALRRIAATFNGDPACAEPARVLRLPGSFNHKYATVVPVTTVRKLGLWLM